MSNQGKKSKTFKVILPVIFTFSASLFMFHGQAHADTNDTTENQLQVTTSAGNSNGTNGNGNNNNGSDANSSANTTSAAASATTSAANAAATNDQSAASSATTNTLYLTNTAISTQASETLDESKVTSAATTNTDPNNGAVTLNQSEVAQANAKSAVSSQPATTSNTYSTSASAQNASGTDTSATAGLNTSGLSQSQINFLASIHDGAINGWKNYGVLPSVTAAQAIIESAWGQSALSTEGHNLFGIKGSYNGQSIYMMTREVYGGRSVYVNAAFRRYDNNAESVEDHGRFLAVNSRYSNLLHQTDYRVVTRLIRQDGYATDPSYTTTLNSVIQRYNLTAWDQQAIEGVTNTGYLDDLSVQNGQLHISGWHASNDYNSSMHHFIILLNADTQQELYRTEVAGVPRTDVQSAYPNLAINYWSGFDITIPYTSALAGHNIQVVSRYTYNTNGEPNGGKDIYYNAVSLNANAGSLDNFDIDTSTNTLNISGWHAADASINEPYHFIIIYDATKGAELGRYLVSNTSRNDVASAYNIYGAANSGFNLSVSLNGLPTGDQIQVISRYSNQSDGEGTYTQYWFAPKTFNVNAGNLDSFTIQNNKLHIEGWQAADASVNEPYRFIILYDATKGKEIKRISVNSVSRSDVESSYSNVYGSENSGFSIDTDFDPAYAGDQIQVIARYSDQSDGEGHYTDYRFTPKSFTDNEAHLDNFSIDGNTVNVSGWHAADESAGKPYHFIILYDATTGKEITRKVVVSETRDDVAAAYPNVYGSENSGFNTSFEIPGQYKGHEIQVISRYSDSPDGEGNYVQYWFDPIKFD